MKNNSLVKSPPGTKLICKGWQQEAAFRMIQNNLDPSNAENPDELIVYGGLGKAGRNRHLGKRPTVRGVAMAPNAHPHGGGEGRSPIGMPGPKTPWGKPALGYRTRKKKKPSSKFIVRRRYER